MRLRVYRGGCSFGTGKAAPKPPDRILPILPLLTSLDPPVQASEIPYTTECRAVQARRSPGAAGSASGWLTGAGAGTGPFSATFGRASAIRANTTASAAKITPPTA